MAIVYTFSSTAALTGAVNFNRVHRIAAQQDVGFMLEKLVSAVNDMQSAVSRLNCAVSAINQGIISGMVATVVGTSGAFSIFSGLGITSTAISFPTGALSVTAISNFTDD